VWAIDVAPGKCSLRSSVRYHHGNWSEFTPDGLAFLPDGRTLATGSEFGKVQLWDWQRGEAVRTLQMRGDLYNAVAAAPDGRHLAVRSSAGAVYILRLAPPQAAEHAPK
jgi:WD40 repeat protein